MTTPSRPKRPTDVNQLANLIGRIATGEVNDDAPPEPSPEKDPAAVALGRKGGKKGGAARAAAMTAEQRSESAARAARARWSAED